MAGFFFIVGNLIILGVNILGITSGNPVIGFSSAVLFATAGITGKVTNNTNIFLFWLSIGLSVLYALFGVFALL